MILVTGATGTTGSAVVREVREKGAPFRVMARNVEKARGLFGDDVEIVPGDLSDPASLGPVVEGVTSLFLLTPPDERMVALNENALVAASEAGVGHVVKLSAIGAATDSPLQLGRWHGEMEAEIAKSGLGWTVLRAGSFMQNFFNHLPTIHGQSQVYSPMGDGKVAMIDTRDIAAAAANVLVAPGAHAGRTYELTGGEALSESEATAIVSNVIGREIAFTEISGEAAAAGMEQMGLPSWLIGDLIALSEMAKAGYMAAVSPHTADLLGRAPRTFTDFAADHRETFSG